MMLIGIFATWMFMGVCLGALGAHALHDTLGPHGLEIWRTAVLYHFTHGVSGCMLGIWRALDPRALRSRWVSAVGPFWLGGTLAFSGSLYVLALGGPRWIGPVTPAGGLALLAGWLCFAVGAFRLKSSGREPGPR